MSSGLYVALSGAVSRLRELDILANNLANLETAGFKREIPVFAVALEASIADLTDEPIGGAARRVFATTQETRIDLTAGPIAETGAPLDVAIDGPGFFAIETPAGTRYTRAGSFAVNANGMLATPAGFPVLGQGGPLQAGDRPVSILASAALVDDRQQEIGKLQIVEFADPGQLTKEGNGLFRPTDETPPQPIPDPHLVERSVERSNARPVEELAALVLLQRSFDSSMRMLQAEDQATAQLIREVSS